MTMTDDRPDPTEPDPTEPGLTLPDGFEALPETSVHAELTADEALAAAGAEAERTSAFEPLPDPEVDALRDSEFAVVWRGYDTNAVDRYVDAVERCIERFDEHRSPSEAVRRALDRVGERTAAILREAERAAEETTTTSRGKADDRLQRAEREAEALWVDAQARVTSLDADVERLWQERERLIDATRELAEGLRGIADDAEARFPPEPGDAGSASTRAPGRNGARPDAPFGARPDAPEEDDPLGARPEPAEED